MDVVSFSHMEDGTADDYRILSESIRKAHVTLADDLLELLQKTETVGMGLKIDRLEHALQTATHAWQDQQDDDMIVAALFHDIADTIAPYNHSDVAAAILRPYVSEKAHWVVKYHGLFQTYYYNHHYGRDRNARDRYKGHPYYQDCVDFCAKYDQMAFDPDFKSMPLEAFVPTVRRVFSRAPEFDRAANDPDA